METEKKRNIHVNREQRFPSISPILSALFVPLPLPLSLAAAMSIHLADGPKSLTCGGNNYPVHELNLGCGDRQGSRFLKK